MNRIPWLWILLLLVVIFLLSWFLCPVFCGCEDGATTKTSQIIEEPKESIKTAAAALGPWVISDNSDLNIRSADYFKFPKSSNAFVTPFSADLEGATNKTAEYLKSHPDRSITVTGYYQSDEEYKGIYPNLGLARSNEIGKYLIGLGVPAAQIINKAQVVNNGSWTQDILQRGADFSFAALVKNDNRLEGIKSKFAANPLTLYFGTNEDQISLSAQQRNDFQDISYYLNNVAGSRINISGHTDATGNRDANVALSKSRADFAKNYLNTNGSIGVNRMVTQGFGPDKPVAGNNTAAGRAKNRRVEITL